MLSQQSRWLVRDLAIALPRTRLAQATLRVIILDRGSRYQQGVALRAAQAPLAAGGRAWYQPG